MKKLLICLLSILPALVLFPGCGGGSSSSGAKTSGLPNRAFVSNFVGSGTSTPGVYIVNAQLDTRPVGIAPISAGNTPSIMQVSPNRAETFVYSGNNLPTSDNQFGVINNATESLASHLTLPGYTESFVVSPDSSTVYVALPSAPVVGQPQGVIEVISVSGGITGQIDIPSVQYLSIDNAGDRLLAFSSNSDSVAVVTPSNLGTQNPLVTYIGGFDRPVQAFFSSDDSTAYVVNCGAECGGQQASIQQLNMTTGTLGSYGAVCATDPTQGKQCAASTALLIGSTMYLAGTPYSQGNSGGPSYTCVGALGETLSCGMLSIFDLNNMTVTNPTPIAITDGYHDRIAMAANGQLLIGARTCTEIIPPQPPPQGAETRGCLSIYNSLSMPVGTVQPGAVIIPPANGDVTGLQPISQRTVAYVVQGGSLSIYDMTIDALEYNPNDPYHPGQIFGLVGYFYDVKTVDF
ncbi:MAG: hypothetical protein ABSD39_21470 [Terriglobales bacterium]